MRSELSQNEGLSRANLYHIKRWFSFYSSQIEFVYQAGGQIDVIGFTWIEWKETSISFHSTPVLTSLYNHLTK